MQTLFQLALLGGAGAQPLLFTVGRQRDAQLIPGCQEDPDVFLVPGFQPSCAHEGNKKPSRTTTRHIPVRCRPFPREERAAVAAGDSCPTCFLSVEKLFDGTSQHGHILKPFDQISLEGQDVGEVLHQPQLRFLNVQQVWLLLGGTDSASIQGEAKLFGLTATTLKPATLSYDKLTLCRNLQSTGTLSFPSFSSTMWVRLCREIFSLQLHTVEQWISESLGIEAKKRRGSPAKSIMTGLADTRESARIKAFTSFSCLSRCC